MAKNVFVGVNNIAKKPRNIYVGVDGKAKRVKEAYVGVDGIAKKIWPSSRIPDNRYQEIEWVFGNIIKTAVPRSSFPRTVIECMPMINDRSGLQFLLEGEFSNNNYGYTIIYDESGNSFVFWVDDRVNVYTNKTEGILVNEKYIFDMRSNGDVYVYCSSGYYSIASHNYLGRIATSYTGPVIEDGGINIRGYGDYKDKFRFYSIKMYDRSGNPIRDFVPCYRISDNQCGYYDVLNRIFYTYYSQTYDPTKDGPIV